MIPFIQHSQGFETKTNEGFPGTRDGVESGCENEEVAQGEFLHDDKVT